MTNSATAASLRSAAALLSPLAALFLPLVAAPTAFGEDMSGESASGVNSVDRPSVMLNAITPADQVTWSLLALLAPGRLADDLPIYVHPGKEALDQLARHMEEEGSGEDGVELDWHVGTALRVGEGWKAYPVPVKERRLSEIVADLRIRDDAGSSLEKAPAGGTSAELASGESGRPRLDVPKLNVPKLNVPKLNVLDVDVLDLNVLELNVPDVGLPGPGSDEDGFHVASNVPLANVRITVRLWVPRDVWKGAIPVPVVLPLAVVPADPLYSPFEVPPNNPPSGPWRDRLTDPSSHPWVVQ